MASLRQSLCRRGRLTIAALAVKYDDFAQAYYVKNGVPTDEKYAIKAAVAPLVRLYGDTPADEFGPKRLKAVRREDHRQGTKTETKAYRGAADSEIHQLPCGDHRANVQMGRRGGTCAGNRVPVLKSGCELCGKVGPTTSWNPERSNRCLRSIFRPF